MGGDVEDALRDAGTERLLDVTSEERRRFGGDAGSLRFAPSEPARHTKDPLGDFAAGRYDPLIDAA